MQRRAQVWWRGVNIVQGDKSSKVCGRRDIRGPAVEGIGPTYKVTSWLQISPWDLR